MDLEKLEKRLEELIAERFSDSSKIKKIEVQRDKILKEMSERLLTETDSDVRNDLMIRRKKVINKSSHKLESLKRAEKIVGKKEKRIIKKIKDIPGYGKMSPEERKKLFKVHRNEDSE